MGFFKQGFLLVFGDHDFSSTQKARMIAHIVDNGPGPMSKQRRHRTKTWYKKHVNDRFVKQSQAEGYRSRAAYKLIELDDKYRIFKRGQRVLDLGAAPGSWSQVAASRTQPKGHIVAVDLLEMSSMANVTFIQGDILAPDTQTEIETALGTHQVDVVLSDIAPNLTGISVSDIARQLEIAQQVLQVAVQWLTPDGTLLLKIFQGEGTDDYLRDVRQHFKKVLMRKPDASRPKSREFYILATGFKAA